MQLKWPMRWDLFSLFPAYAGVIPRDVWNSGDNTPFPRIRGGDPKVTAKKVDAQNFSPHTRG